MPKKSLNKELSVRAILKNDISKKDRTIAESNEYIIALEKKIADWTRNLVVETARNEAILSSIGDGVIVVDKEGQIIFVNRIFEKILGWKQQETMGRSITEIIIREDAKGHPVSFKEKIMPKVLSGETVIADISSPFYYTRKDNKKIPVSAVVSPVVIEKSVVGAVEILRDITKEKEIDRMKNEFVSLASHQLRTPLTSVRWFSEMLLDEDVGRLNKKQKNYVEEIYQGNERMIDLVRKLLNTSRIEMGVLAVDSGPAEIGKLFKEIIKEQTPFIQAKKHEIIVKIPKGLPKIFTDQELVRMIIRNLFGNAIEYTPTGGKITCTLEKKDKKMIIGIQDTGIGIPEKQQNQVFQKLFRGDNAIRDHSEGTGLELYITKAMVDALSGKIWFKSKEGEGTTFWVALPLSGPKSRPGRKIINKSHDQVK
jgi:PAS domain S-box-containing protein